MSQTPPPVVLVTPDILEELCAQAFPGVPIRINASPGLHHCSWAVLDFKMALTLTVKQMSYSDQLGSVQSVFIQTGKKSIRKRTFEGVEEVQAELAWFTQYLMGIVATIEMAFQEQPPEEDPDAFTL